MGDNGFNRAIAGNNRVDILRGIHAADKRSFDHVAAKIAAATDNTALDIDLAVLIFGRGRLRQKAIHRYFDLMIRDRRFEFPLTISSSARSVLGMRAVRDLPGSARFSVWMRPMCRRRLPGSAGWTDLGEQHRRRLFHEHPPAYASGKNEGIRSPVSTLLGTLVEPKDLYYAVYEAVVSLFGDVAAAAMQPSVLAVEKGYALLRCRRGAEREFAIALSTLFACRDSTVAIRVLAVSGDTREPAGRIATIMPQDAAAPGQESGPVQEALLHLRLPV